MLFNIREHHYHPHHPLTYNIDFHFQPAFNFCISMKLISLQIVHLVTSEMQTPPGVTNFFSYAAPSPPNTINIFVIPMTDRQKILFYTAVCWCQAKHKENYYFLFFWQYENAITSRRLIGIELKMTKMKMYRVHLVIVQNRILLLLFY